MELLQWPTKPNSTRGIDLPWEPLLIMPIGDIQYSGARGPADLKRLRRHIEWGVEHGCYFLGMGDYVDFMSPSNRQRHREAALYDTAEDVIDEAASQLEQELFEDTLAPSVDRWLGLLEGHHYFEHLDGTTSDQRLARLLHTRFLGTSAYIRLSFREQGRRAATAIYAWHGAGGAQTVGAPLLRLERLAAFWPQVQLFLMGHYHRLATTPIQRILTAGRGDPTFYHLRTYLVLTGGFMRGYLENNRVGNRPRGTYVEQRGLAPTALGGPLVTLTPRRLTAKQGNVRTELDIVDVQVSI